VWTYACILVALALAPLGCGSGGPGAKPAPDADTRHAELVAAIGAIREQQAEMLERVNRTASLVDVMIKRGIMVIPPGKSWPEKTALRIPAGNSAKQGSVHAPVRVFEFADFECPYCQAAADVPDQLLEEFPGEVEFVFKHNPLTKRHPNAEAAARAAIAAGKQDKFWEMHDLLFASGRLGPDDLRAHARSLGLDMEKFEKDLTALSTRLMIDRDRSLARDVGADTTPTFFVNGKLVEGTTYPEVRTAVTAELRYLTESGELERRSERAKAAREARAARRARTGRGKAPGAARPAPTAEPSSP
jgi:protein-disulfide isomerase